MMKTRTNISKNPAGSFIAAFTQTVSHALDSVGYSGYISIDPVFNSIGSQIAQRPQKYYYHYNHQGSVALVTWQNGTIRQHLQYLPYGGIFVDHRTGSYSSPYTFSAKEKDAESGYNYFGARYYTDNIMMWLSVDPMSDERPWISPYNYCQWNPIGRVDTWGMLDDEWEVDKDGCISWLNANKHYDACGNEVDVLYNSSGDNSIEVSKEFMGSEEVCPVNTSKGPRTICLYNVTGDDKAKEIFEFMAENTNVEWGWIQVGEERSQENFITTENHPSKNGGVGLVYSRGYDIRDRYHNHFISSKPSNSDINAAKTIQKQYPKSQSFIYFRGIYFKLDGNGNFGKTRIMQF